MYLDQLAMNPEKMRNLFLEHTLSFFTGLLPLLPSYPTIKYTEGGKEKTEVMNRYFLMYKDEQTKRPKDDIKSERKWRKWVDDELVHKLR